MNNNNLDIIEKNNSVKNINDNDDNTNGAQKKEICIGLPVSRE